MIWWAPNSQFWSRIIAQFKILHRNVLQSIESELIESFSFSWFQSIKLIEWIPSLISSPIDHTNQFRYIQEFDCFRNWISYFDIVLHVPNTFLALRISIHLYLNYFIYIIALTTGLAIYGCYFISLLYDIQNDTVCVFINL